jgi:hypothetical protein
VWLFRTLLCWICQELKRGERLVAGWGGTADHKAGSAVRELMQEHPDCIKHGQSNAHRPKPKQKPKKKPKPKVHKSRYRCPECGAGFKRWKDWKNHQRTALHGVAVCAKYAAVWLAAHVSSKFIRNTF